VQDCPICISKSIYRELGKYPGEFINCSLLLECLDCGLIFTHPLPSNNELKEYYSSGLYYDKAIDPYNGDFIEVSLQLSRSRLMLLKKYVDFVSSLKVLDIGAGNAQFSKALKEQNNKSIYDAVEPDSKVSSHYGNHVDSRYSAINEVEKKDYDIVVLNQVLEHVPDPVDFLSLISKFIRQGGYIYIDVPNQDHLYKSRVDTHILFWNHKCLINLVEKIGFKVLFCDTAGMEHHDAKNYFYKQSIFFKIINIWNYKEKINAIGSKYGFGKTFNTFKRYKSDHYGGDRQWLRCIVQKIYK